MANNQKDNRSGDSRLGQDKKGGTQSSAKNNPSGESRGPNPGALHDKGNLGKSDKDKDKDRGGSRM